MHRLDQGRADKAAVVAKLGAHNIDGFGCYLERHLFGGLSGYVEEEIDTVDHATTKHHALRVPEVDEAGEAKPQVEASFPHAVYHQHIAFVNGLRERAGPDAGGLLE